MLAPSSEPRQWWIEFTGDPRDDVEHYKRYVSGTEFKPIGLSDEIVHVVEMAAYEDVIKRLGELESELAQLRLGT